jgi:hypothetical protein
MRMKGGEKMNELMLMKRDRVKELLWLLRTLAEKLRRKPPVIMK